MAGQGLVKRRTALHVALNLADGVAQNQLLHLLAQNVQHLGQRQAGANHGRQLPRNKHEIFNISASAFQLLLACFAFRFRPRGGGLDRGGNQTLIFQGLQSYCLSGRLCTPLN